MLYSIQKHLQHCKIHTTIESKIHETIALHSLFFHISFIAFLSDLDIGLTGRFDSTFPNPIVNLDFHMKTDPGVSWVSNDK